MSNPGAQCRSHCYPPTRAVYRVAHKIMEKVLITLNPTNGAAAVPVLRYIIKMFDKTLSMTIRTTLYLCKYMYYIQCIQIFTPPCNARKRMCDTHEHHPGNLRCRKHLDKFKHLDTCSSVQGKGNLCRRQPRVRCVGPTTHISGVSMSGGDISQNNASRRKEEIS